ncbi:site-specific DNA-methyltransferase [Photobacterium alginatilyticum]|uniref:site-specific DNA-methyltransferase (adenine-specific) n=1 Tax=Photobacterium alginatilyticum TaxID=1775171 RepID=A0ABW9YKY5_9GAMM|nr:site-specific DNA-methyltransferase [Photobacterium alginatilyticum]NBI53734.1 site-specific DNA-methyltransferase [Photobacterium alginatilyticum]
MNNKKQKLELNWIGKEKRPRLEPRIFLEDEALSYHSTKAEQALDSAQNASSTSNQTYHNNLLIHGDNLLALKALEQDYAGKVKCVYIDPPYNTGSAFEQYDDGLEHSMWLSLIRSRIELLWSMLDPEEGSLWVSIDDNEMPYLRVLLDEICGRSCFIAANVWQKRYSRENRAAIGDVHEYILVYAKQPLKFKANRNKLPLTEKQAKVYKNPTNDPKGPWRTIPITAQAGHATAAQFYEIIGPTGKVFNPPPGNCWRYSKPVFEQLLNDGRIYFGKKGDSQPTTIRYLSEVEGAVPWTWWPHEEVGNTDESKKESIALFGKSLFDTPKPERLLERIIHIATNPGDIVLDSFAGSGTTGAVAQKMGRRWIMVELGEHCETHIAPRLKKVIDGEDQGGISKSFNWQGGGGFRYLRLAPSLLKKDEWGNWIINKEYNAEMLTAAMCKHMGFTYAPSENQFWNQGFSTETDFIYITTGSLAYDQLKRISEEVGSERTLLICCKAFMSEGADFPNLTIKKIPQAILNKCEWDNDDYSFTLNVLPDPEEEIIEEEMDD